MLEALLRMLMLRKSEARSFEEASATCIQASYRSFASSRRPEDKASRSLSELPALEEASTSLELLLEA